MLFEDACFQSSYRQPLHTQRCWLRSVRCGLRAVLRVGTERLREVPDGPLGTLHVLATKKATNGNSPAH